MIIYKTINDVNGRIYIGKDARNRKSYLGSGKVLKLAIAKYGKENFTKIVIDEASTLDELAEKEIYWISFFDARNPAVGYNRAEGGLGGGGNGSGWRKGRTFTVEHKKKIGIATKRNAKNPEYIEKLSIAKLGIKKSEEIRKRMTEAKKKWWTERKLATQL